MGDFISVLAGFSFLTLFWILALIKLVKQEGGFVLFIKYFVGTGSFCVILSSVITAPMWDCTGFLCGFRYVLVAMLIDGILIFSVGIVLYLITLSREQELGLAKNQRGYEDILDDLET